VQACRGGSSELYCWLYMECKRAGVGLVSCTAGCSAGLCLVNCTAGCTQSVNVEVRPTCVSKTTVSASVTLAESSATAVHSTCPTSILPTFVIILHYERHLICCLSALTLLVRKLCV